MRPESGAAVIEHRLQPLLAPRSVAVIGASAQDGRPGNEALRALELLDFPGAVYPVNPNQASIRGLDTYARLADVPEAVDLAIVAGASARLEDQVRDAIDCGAAAVVAFANSRLEVDPEPTLLARVRALADGSGVPFLGPNSLGFVNYASRAAATWVPPVPAAPGPVAMIIQSGSTYSYSNILDPRVRFNLTIHPGQEIDVGVAELIDYVLEAGDSRVIGLYLETIRAPAAFAAALERAAAMDVPVVALKSGRSERGAAFAATHAGRLTSSDRAFDALCRRHGVLRVETNDEWLTTVQLLGHDRRPGPGGAGAIFDSGAQRALVVDHADKLGVRWSEIGPATLARLRERLDFTLEPANPVDAWAGDRDWQDVFSDCLGAVMNDPDTALGILFAEIGAWDEDPIVAELAGVCRRVAAATDKPVVAANCTSRQIYPRNVLALDASGVPVLDGGETTMRAVGHAFAYRDFRRQLEEPAPPPADPATVRAWRDRLGRGPLGEADGLELLDAFGVPGVACMRADDAEGALDAAARLGYPVALKTAQGLAHKTDASGVVLGLEAPRALAAAYEDLHARLGPRVLVQAMVDPGVEIALGCVTDPEFGPLVMVGAGGTLVEVLDDACLAVPPFGVASAHRLIDELRIARVLAGVRGRPPSDREALAIALSRFSVMVAALGDLVAEIDVNPLIASPAGVTAVDAVVRRHADPTQPHPE